VITMSARPKRSSLGVRRRNWATLGDEVVMVHEVLNFFNSRRDSHKWSRTTDHGSRTGHL
jgi:hypothetical protein